MAVYVGALLVSVLVVHVLPPGTDCSHCPAVLLYIQSIMDLKRKSITSPRDVSTSPFSASHSDVCWGNNSEGRLVEAPLWYATGISGYLRRTPFFLKSHPYFEVYSVYSWVFICPFMV